ncbi:MAG: LutB/LldF family L-lactate oxidation iron-sulfur protein [Bacteroidales bacterium]
MSEPRAHEPGGLRGAAIHALGDAHLRNALQHLATVIGGRRNAAVDAVGDWEVLRERARAIKDHTLANLDTYLASFVRNAERAGARVHRAPDAKAATSIVIGLLGEAGATRVVKSKSMATEEIHLNAALEAAGVHPLETDLGEWIIQLAGETPSHIVVPAIHKSRRQIAELFSEKLGIALTDDVAELTRTARRVLRAHFAAAQAGISGANFGVADTGTILILENEGNARLTTSVPRTHIAVMGIEKLVPRLEDLDVFLKLLPRSGTGQQLTAYQSLITGVKRSADGEGPDAVHIVLLDNGRSRLLRDPLTRQTLACIRCGACLNACPVYRQIGGHAYGSVYPGPIGAILTPQLGDLGANADLPYASSLCDACRDVCPVKIDIPALLLRLRAEIVEGTTTGTAERCGPVKRAPAERMAFRAFSWAASSPWRFRWGARLARLGQRLVVKDGRIRRVSGVVGRLAPPLAAWTGQRDLRPLAPKSFSQMWPGQLAKSGGPCAQDLAAARGEPAPAAAPHPVASDPALSDRAGLVQRFCSALDGVAANWVVVSGISEARDAVRGLLESYQPRRIALSDAAVVHRVLEAIGSDAEMLVSPRESALFACEVGITSAQWGIVETGTLVLAGDAERHRLASLVPPVHIALLEAERLRATLGDVLQELAGREPDQLVRCVTFITGPSRTSDIELTLAIGVHGPGQLHVVLIT